MNVFDRSVQAECASPITVNLFVVIENSNKVIYREILNPDSYYSQSKFFHGINISLKLSFISCLSSSMSENPCIIVKADITNLNAMFNRHRIRIL